MTPAQLAELEGLRVKATQGPFFLGDDVADGTPHANSGLALIDTGRAEDWTVASLMEWPTAAYVTQLLNLAPELIKRAKEREAATLAERERCLAIVRRLLPMDGHAKFMEIERRIQSGEKP